MTFLESICSLYLVQMQSIRLKSHFFPAVIGTQEVFDGFRFEFNRTIQDQPHPFALSHSIGMGSALEPANYNFGTNLVYGSVSVYFDDLIL